MGKSKKELDRDMMFRKIMPALADNPFSSPIAEPAPEQSTSSEVSSSPQSVMQEFPGMESEVSPTSSSIEPECLSAAPKAASSTPTSDTAPQPNTAQPALTPVETPTQELRTVSRAPVEHPLPPIDDPADDNLSVLRTRLFARSGIGAVGAESVCTINLMESLVLKYLDEVIQRFNCCRCDRCRRDIAALALNHLPAQYIVADPSNMDEIEQKIPKKTVLDALVKSVIQVRAYPRH